MKAELIDVMGDDLRVVNAARVSFDKESEWEEYDSKSLDGFGEMIVHKKLSEKDQGLLRYLAKHNHWTPFSHVMITMRETVPIFVARQRFKHTVGFSYNEVSRRYVSDEPEFFYPDKWRKAADNKKQGSSDEVINLNDFFMWTDEPYGMFDDYSVAEMYDEIADRTLLLYNRMIEIGVAPEQARMVLPQSMYTSYYTTGSLSAWARMVNLRRDSHAQKEIQDLAKMCDENIRGIPELKYSWEALVGPKWY